MTLTDEERGELSQRLKYLQDVGGKLEVSRRAGVHEVSIYNAIKPGQSIKPITLHKIRVATTALEAYKESLLIPV